MSSPMDFSKFIDPNASTGTGADDRHRAGDGETVRGSTSWSMPSPTTGDSSPWLAPSHGASDPLSGLQIASADESSMTPAAAPVAWLYASIGSAVIGALLAWVVSVSAWVILGWLFAGPIAIGLLGFYHKTDTFRRASGHYSEQTYARMVYVTAIAVGLVAVLVTAVFVGLWWGRA